MTQPVQHATTEQMEQVDPAILRAFPELNDAQRQAIASTEGPVLLIAGPGTGKTLVLVLRTLNLIMRGLAMPREIVLCTFTEKAALELRDRIAAAAQKVGCDEDRSELLVGTIHGICNDFIERNRHRTRLGNNYEVLDELTQKLFVFEHFSAIVGEERGGRFLGRWSSKWRAIDGICKYFVSVR